MTSKQAVVELADNAGFWWVGTNTDDVIIRTTDSTQAIYVSTMSNAQPALTVTGNSLTVAGTVTASAWSNLPADAGGIWSSNLVGAGLYASNAVPQGAFASNAIVGAASGITFASNLAVYGSNEAVAAYDKAAWGSNNIGGTSFWQTSNSVQYTASNVTVGSASNTQLFQVSGTAGLRRLLIGRDM